MAKGLTFGLDRARVERREIAARSVILTLPNLPPSTNNLYANAGNRRVKTKVYEDWLWHATLFLNRQVASGRVSGRVDITITIEDTHANRDVSNCLKPIEDALVKAGAIFDDRSKYVRSIKGAWGDVQGIKIEIARAA